MSHGPNMTETIKRKLKEKGIGRYEVMLLGSKQMPNEKRHDLEATNVAVAEILKDPQSEKLHLFVSVYGITGETIPKRKKESGFVILDVNVFNILLAASRNSLFCILARHSNAAERSKGAHSIFVFLCKDPTAAKSLEISVNQVCRTFHESMKDAQRSSAERTLHDARPMSFEHEPSLPPRPNASQVKFKEDMVQVMSELYNLTQIPEVDEDHHAEPKVEEPPVVEEEEEEEEEDDEEAESFLGMAAGLEPPNEAFLVALSKNYVRTGDSDFEVKVAEKRSSVDYKPPALRKMSNF